MNVCSYAPEMIVIAFRILEARDLPADDPQWNDFRNFKAVCNKYGLLPHMQEPVLLLVKVLPVRFTNSCLTMCTCR